MLLIDEVDKTDVEVEGLLLEVLSDFQVTIPELGTVVAVRRPFVVLTSNATRELSEALKRRCLYLHLDYPDAEREREIVLSQVPDLEERVAGQLVATVGPAARARAQEGAVDRRVGRLGAHPDRARDRRPRRRGRSTHARRGPQARLRPRAGDPGAAAGTADDRRAACVDRHIAFLEALRGAGAAGVAGRGPRRVAALERPRLGRARDRPGAYAATLVKRQSQRPTFDALFDLYFPRWSARGAPARGRPPTPRPRRGRVRDNAPGARPSSASGWPRRSADGDQEALARLAVEMVGRFGAMPAAGRGCPLVGVHRAAAGRRRSELVDRIVAGAARRRAAPRRRRGASPAAGSAAFTAAGRGRRPPPDRRGEGARPRRRRRGPAEHRPDRLHRRPQGRPRGDAPRDLPAGPPARDPAHPGAPRRAAAARSTSGVPSAPRSPPAASR